MREPRIQIKLSSRHPCLTVVGGIRICGVGSSIGVGGIGIGSGSGVGGGVGRGIGDWCGSGVGAVGQWCSNNSGLGGDASDDGEQAQSELYKGFTYRGCFTSSCI